MKILNGRQSFIRLILTSRPLSKRKLLIVVVSKSSTLTNAKLWSKLWRLDASPVIIKQLRGYASYQYVRAFVEYKEPCTSIHPWGLCHISQCYKLELKLGFYISWAYTKQPVILMCVCGRNLYILQILYLKAVITQV